MARRYRIVLNDAQIAEVGRCAYDPVYFINNYVQIYDARTGLWIPFHLWPEQEQLVREFLENPLHIILKARQLGFTWLCLAFALWLMLFRPAATILVFSLAELDAMYLLGPERLRGMFERLPDWLKPESVEVDDKKTWMLSNGSIARAFPVSRGDGYTGTFLLVDEADLPSSDAQRDLDLSVEPTIAAGGWYIKLSKSDKKKPDSPFKATYRAAKEGKNLWKPHFFPWYVHPDRTQEWYQQKCDAAMAEEGTLDSVHENYPATDAEALQERSADKRFAYEWIQGCYQAMDPVPEKEINAYIEARNKDLPEKKRITIAHPGLKIYKLPEPGRKYDIGADPAEGNPNSDDSAFDVLDYQTWEQVATFAGKLEPGEFAKLIWMVSRLYNDARSLTERNNHGHAVLLWQRENTSMTRLYGIDGNPGYHTTEKSKHLMMDDLAQGLKDGDYIIHELETMLQIASINAKSLRAPEGRKDDRAMSFALTSVAVRKSRGGF